MAKGKSKKPAVKAKIGLSKPKLASFKSITTRASSGKKISLAMLNKWNWALAGLHGLQAILIIVLSNAYYLPVNTNYLAVDTLASEGVSGVVLSPAARHLFDINLVYIVALFFLLSAIAHLLSAKFLRSRYEASLKEGVNKIRWIEYSLSASVMMLAISLIAGIYDLSSLIMIFGLVAVMNLLGLVMELHNQKSAKISWLSYIVGCVAGIIPWIVYVIYVFGSSVYGNASPPTFVYFILVSIFLLFNSFAVNMFLQYKKKGKWVDYLYGERGYMTLSLVAKSALAWQVYAGILRP